jgi:hypothetical protein
MADSDEVCMRTRWGHYDAALTVKLLLLRNGGFQNNGYAPLQEAAGGVLLSSSSSLFSTSLSTSKHRVTSLPFG